MSIINPRHGHIFIHVPKTAGTSMEKLGWVGGSGHGTIEEILNNGHDGKGHEYKSDYFKWAFVRNPYDKLVSSYHYCMQRNGICDKVKEYKDFADMVRNLKNDDVVMNQHMFRPQYTFITVKGYLVMDFVGRYERLYEDFAKVCKTLNTPTGMDCLNRSSHGPWKDYYDDGLKKIVRDIYQKDFDFFNYKA